MSTENNDFLAALMSVGKDTKFPIAKLLRNPDEAALLSKVVRGINTTERYDKNGNRDAINPDISQIRNIASRTTQSINDNRTVLQLLPDLRYASKIIIASTLSPRDLMTVELTYLAPKLPIPTDVSTAMINALKEHYEVNYKIIELLPEILNRGLFETGSYPIAIIPENALDNLINGANFSGISKESLDFVLSADGSYKSLGTLGNADESTGTLVNNRRASIESFAAYSFEELVKTYNPKIALPNFSCESHISVTDNFNILRLPEQMDQIRKGKMRQHLRVGAAIEGYTSKKGALVTDRKIEAQLFQHRDKSHTPVAYVKTTDNLERRSVGEPLEMHLPSESVVNVHVPGKPDEHVCHFILTDMDGFPLSSASDTNYSAELQQRFNNPTGGMASTLLDRVKGEMNGFNANTRGGMDTIVRSYTAMVENNLLARLRNGIYGDKVQFASNQEVYRIMLARSLQGKGTQLICVPAELMCYFAFDYTEDGIGKSLLEDMKVINSLRCVLKFVNVQAAIKNSIGRTEVKIKLDEEDPDPRTTIERAYHEIMRTRGAQFPGGIVTPTDIADWLAGAGMEFTYEGHPGIPDVAIDFGEKSSSHVQPATELDDSLRRESIMHLGVPPEIVDNTFQSEFATSVVTNNLLLAKTALQIQTKLEAQLADYMRKLAFNSERIVSILTKILEDKIEEITTRLDKSDEYEFKRDKNYDQRQLISEILEMFLNGFTVSLPKPNSATIENQKEALESYTELLDKAIDAYVSSEIVNSELNGDVAQYVDAIKGVIRARFIRTYMAENGIMPELAELIHTDEDGRPVVDIYEENAKHTENLTASLTFYMTKINDAMKAANDVNSNRTGDEAGGYESTGGDSSGGDGGDSSAGGDEFGSDDFGSDPSLDENLDENPENAPEEEAPEDNPPDKDPEPEPESEEPKKTEEPKE
jgi:hypothetical protein